MYHYFFYRALGYLSIFAGLLGIGCMFKMQNLFYAISLSILGFIFSGINIFMNVKHYQEKEKWPLGYLGMFFSSVPVIFLLVMIFKMKRTAI
jgi:hypothetical protein